MNRICLIFFCLDVPVTPPKSQMLLHHCSFHKPRVHCISGVSCDVIQSIPTRMSHRNTQSVWIRLLCHRIMTPNKLLILVFNFYFSLIFIQLLKQPCCLCCLDWMTSLALLPQVSQLSLAIFELCNGSRSQPETVAQLNGVTCNLTELTTRSQYSQCLTQFWHL